MKLIVFIVLFLSTSIIYDNCCAQSSLDWELQQSGTIDYLWSVQFLDTAKGWAVGNKTVLHTNDAGQNWVEQNIDAGDHYLWDVSFTDSLNGWVVGEYYYNNPYGAIFHTNDGGQNWVLQYESNEWEFNGIQFIDSLRGWVVGGNSYPAILYTENGGENWEIQFSSTTLVSYCEDVSFCNDSIGWVVGSYGLVMNTTDGGSTWNMQNSYVNNFIRSVQALSTTLVYACGSSGLFLFTYDGGINWHHIPPNSFYNNLFGIYFLDSLNGWITGDVGLIYYTTDGGMNWTDVDFGFYDYFHDIFFYDSSNGWLVGMNGLIYHTINGGGLMTGLQESDQNTNNMQLSIFPNPFTTSFKLVFDVNKTERVQISINDLEGNTISIISDDVFYRGRHRIDVDQLENLSKGIYIIRLRTQTDQIVKKLVHLI